MGKRAAIRALCVGWLSAAIALVAIYAVPAMPFTAQLVVIAIAGLCPTLFMLNLD